jgi:hypothetical protein
MNKNIKHKWFYFLFIIIIICLIALFYGINNHRVKSNIVTNSTDNISKGSTLNGGVDSSSSLNKNIATPENSKSSPSQVSNNLSVSKPSGNFVSNHHPKIGENSSQNQMTSVCNTTPGANCNIEFTLGSTTKSLGPKVTDAQGFAYWSWNLEDLGFSEGTWEIKATASESNNIMTSIDSMGLVITK